jgi:hypothetical protein
MRRRANQRNPKRASDRLTSALKIPVAGEKGASRRELSRGKCLPESPSSDAAISFREMGDFKALQRLFLQTSGVTPTGAGRRGNPLAVKRRERSLPRLFGLGKVAVSRFDEIRRLYPTFLEKGGYFYIF